MAVFGKSKVSVNTKLQDTKRLADVEAHNQTYLFTKFKNLSSYSENMRMRMDKEGERKGYK